MSSCCVNCLSQWKSWIRPLFILTYALAALIFVPIYLFQSIEEGFQERNKEVLIGGIFAWVAVPISFWEIILHVIHYTRPKLQKHIIRILWMVPIYAVNAWLGLVNPKNALYVDSLRECYEAYVIYNFMRYLLNYLNMEMDLEASLEVKPQVKHIFPLCCLPDWKMGREFVQTCKHGILQYTVIRPTTSIIAVLCHLAGIYGGGEFRLGAAYPYILVVNNLSQFVAMYCLVMFYKANIHELRPMKPFPKFLCIKAVVFMTFFQGVVIDFLVYQGVIVPNSDTRQEEQDLSTRLQDFLLCIEMCLAAIAHHYAFSYEPYVIPGGEQSCCYAFLAMWDVSDVQSDIQEHLGIVGGSISRRIRGRSSYTVPRGIDQESPNLLCGSIPEGLYQNECDDFVINYSNITNQKSSNR
ncbi:hypothetical protein WA026_014035 [Henosepilachna vigintioctopunctata]|uniref:Organic solute transporter ostalpha n=1 Tax=Henosepilachna vigintioctopunctata TaxID=420089 RepID=A0AAW1U6V1_9CUCU